MVAARIALRPLAVFNKIGNPIAQEDDDEREYRTLVPLIDGYVVADAAMILAMIYSRSYSKDDAEADAVYRLQSILEAFVANARISTADCAEARAHIAALSARGHLLPQPFGVRRRGDEKSCAPRYQHHQERKLSGLHVWESSMDDERAAALASPSPRTSRCL
jgi:hypothetical protein